MKKNMKKSLSRPFKASRAVDRKQLFIEGWPEGERKYIIDFVCVFAHSARRTLWKKCCFSGDGEYIVAGSARQHALYIWEVSIGNIVKILHGTKGELLLDVVVSNLES